MEPPKAHHERPSTNYSSSGDDRSADDASRSASLDSQWGILRDVHGVGSMSLDSEMAYAGMEELLADDLLDDSRFDAALARSPTAHGK